jgi:membrane protein implicated in regulation of membrane protease activity
MSSLQDEFKIALNQNLWGLVVGLSALGVAEYYYLCWLFWFSFAVSLMMVVSIAFTTYFYTRNYCNSKSSRSKEGKQP